MQPKYMEQKLQTIGGFKIINYVYVEKCKLGKYI